MKRTINKYLLPALAVAAMTFGACSDWTQTESLPLHYPTLEEQNPALYQRYMESLCAYKAGEHKVVIATLVNTGKAPERQNEHLTVVPDSVDYINLTNPADLHPMLAAEIQKVHEKGTRVVYSIDYSAIEAEWKQILADEQATLAEAGGESVDPTPEEILEQRFRTFIDQRVNMQIAYCGQFGFDGIIACYEGMASEAMSEAIKAIHTARQAAFLEPIKKWLGGSNGKHLLFQGNPRNLFDKSVLNTCKYLIISLPAATSSDEFAYAVIRTSVPGVPTDRFVVGVTAPSIVDPTDESGYFAGLDADGTSKLRATKGAAQWVVAPSATYTKAGIAIANAQNDYFNITFVYKNIREAISIMNPAPKN